jgi:hypothetical protein
LESDANVQARVIFWFMGKAVTGGGVVSAVYVKLHITGLVVARLDGHGKMDMTAF